MRQIQGSWRMEARRDGAARFILKSSMGEQIYMDFSPDDLGDLRSSLEELAPAKSIPAEVAPAEAPKPIEPIPSRGRRRRTKA